MHITMGVFREGGGAGQTPPQNFNRWKEKKIGRKEKKKSKKKEENKQQC